MELPNMDCEMDPDELDRLAEIFHFAEQYALHKRDAMLARLAGNVEKAVEIEKTCDLIYQQLPAESHW